MATEKQIAANRQNAQHCTGPKTPEGKAISSQNALKTGIDAQSDVTRVESREAYEALIAAYHAQYQPASEEERFLVDDLIRTEWLSRRYMCAAAAIWDRDLVNSPQTPLGAIVAEYSQTMSRIQRCISANKRDALAILKRLEALQAQKPARPAPEALPTGTENEPLTPKLVSFVQVSEDPGEPTAETNESTPAPEKIPPLAA